MPAEFSSNCECSSCLEGTQSENDWNPSSITEDDDFLYPTSRKKCLVSPIMQRFLSQCCSSTLENDNQEHPMFRPSEEESLMEFSQETPGDTKRKTKPLRELTIQELLRESEDSKKFQANFMSLGQFRDHVVMKFRRTLYHAGIRVKHVQGQRLKRHFSANYFKRNPSRLHRLIPWLKRELTAVYGDYGYTVKNILAAILHHMTKFDLDSESFCDLLEPYLLQYTYHFLHEFISFVDSSYNMETYDRQAIYRFPSASTWLKNETTASIPALPLPKDHALRIYQQTIKQSENSQVQRSKMEERPQCRFKQFPNGNLFSNDSKILPSPHNTANKTHVWTKDESKADDHKSIDSANAMFPNWAAAREKGLDILNCQRDDQKKKTEEAMLFPGHVQDLRKSVYNLRETKTLNPSQQMQFQKTEVEKSKLKESSPKFFQKSPIERFLTCCKFKERKPSCNHISENVLTNRKLSYFKQEGITYSQSSQIAEVGSHCSRRIQRQLSSRNHRSKSWCAGYRKRLLNKNMSIMSLRVSHRSEHFTQNVCREPTEKNVRGRESMYWRASTTPGQYGKFSSTSGKRSNLPSEGKGDSQTRRHCYCLTCLQTGKHRSPSKQEMKEKNHVFQSWKKQST